MTIELSIENVIRSYIQKKQITLKDLAEQTNINRGNMSAAINRNSKKILSIPQLDSLTEVVGFPKGALYDAFFKDFKVSKIDMRRTRKFILACADLKRLDLINQIIEFCYEDRKFITNAFEIAEELYNLEFKDSASILYNSVVKYEFNANSDRLSISYYRLFIIHKDDTELGFKYASQFYPYRLKLPLDLKLDGIVALAYAYGVQNKWSDVDILSEELRVLTQTIYDQELYKDDDFLPARPFVYYFGQSYLMRESMFEFYKEYEKALLWNEKYRDLSWFKDLDEKGKEQVELYTHFAETNLRAIHLKMGDESVVMDYYDSLKNDPTEMTFGITNILEAANKYTFNIDNILVDYEEFSQKTYVEKNESKKYTKLFMIQHQANLDYQYAIYLFNSNNHSLGIKKLLQSLYNSVTIANITTAFDCVLTFNGYREYATKEQIIEFNNICKGALTR
ncbi:hypothetical protein PaeCFBP13512_22450 [Paenibacillus sp. CFBP13512]|uniref:hypothetical protein n=1 Tax=Paenibacillus sp. CFBP13512 TaxID=2184007 RepID=UPI0010C0DE34|nr:hypothetical protein [Paenibacillus sp. CFBP13512]TKJ83780.1 hypothetical protein PaeCFBP13512_22450 [Paenibacillus sp. CFBP13512]